MLGDHKSYLTRERSGNGDDGCAREATSLWPWKTSYAPSHRADCYELHQRQHHHHHHHHHHHVTTSLRAIYIQWRSQGMGAGAGYRRTPFYPVASLGWVTPGAATEGVTPIFPEKN